jgi:radical SAM superfamily enzyme YgiQ (UPF0313 family)
VGVRVPSSAPPIKMKTFNAVILTDSIRLDRSRPLGAFAIANELRANGYTCLVIDFAFQMSRKDLLEILDMYVTEETKIFGYSSTFFRFDSDGRFDTNVTYKDLLNLNSLVKSKNPKIKIIFGGANSYKLVEESKKEKTNFLVDYVFHGYSEGMITEFVNGNDFCNKIKKLDFNLNEVSFDITGSQFNFRNSCHHWLEEDAVMLGEPLPIEFARGCIFKCKFCSYPLLGKNPNDDSYLKTEESLYREIVENYEKYKTLNYIVMDDTFNERIDKLELALKVRDRTKLDLNFVGYNRLDLIARKPQQIQLLKDLNFTGFWFGLETLNYETSKIIGKGIKKEEVAETLYSLRKAYNDRISITSSFIIGLPRESKESFIKNYNWAISENSGIDTIIINPLVLSRTSHTNSEFYSNPAKYGYIPKADGSWVSSMWDYKDALSLYKDLKKDLFQMERQKVGMFSAMGFVPLGFDYFDVITQPWKKFHTSSLTLNKKRNLYIQKYVNKLKNLRV